MADVTNRIGVEFEVTTDGDANELVTAVENVNDAAEEAQSPLRELTDQIAKLYNFTKTPFELKFKPPEEAAKWAEELVRGWRRAEVQSGRTARFLSNQFTQVFPAGAEAKRLMSGFGEIALQTLEVLGKVGKAGAGVAVGMLAFQALKVGVEYYTEHLEKAQKRQQDFFKFMQEEANKSTDAVRALSDEVNAIGNVQTRTEKAVSSSKLSGERDIRGQEDRKKEALFKYNQQSGFFQAFSESYGIGKAHDALKEVEDAHRRIYEMRVEQEERIANLQKNAVYEYAATMEESFNKQRGTLIQSEGQGAGALGGAELQRRMGMEDIRRRLESGEFGDQNEVEGGGYKNEAYQRALEIQGNKDRYSNAQAVMQVEQAIANIRKIGLSEQHKADIDHEAARKKILAMPATTDTQTKERDRMLREEDQKYGKESSERKKAQAARDEQARLQVIAQFATGEEKIRAQTALKMAQLNERARKENEGKDTGEISALRSQALEEESRALEDYTLKMAGLKLEQITAGKELTEQEKADIQYAKELLALEEKRSDISKEEYALRKQTIEQNKTLADANRARSNQNLSVALTTGTGGNATGTGMFDPWSKASKLDGLDKQWQQQEALIKQLQQAGASMPADIWDQMAEKYTQAKEDILTNMDVIKEQAQQAATTLGQGIGNALANMVKGTGSAASVLKAMLADLLKQAIAFAAAAASAALVTVNPFLALGVIPLAAGILTGLTSLLTAEKGFDVPAFSSPTVKLHPKEMVLPAPLAEKVRNLDGNSSAGGGNTTVNLNVSGALDGQQVLDALSRHETQFMTMISRAQRRGRGR